MRAHEAGVLHAEALAPRPSWLRPPDDVNALQPTLWPSTVRRGPDGVLSVGGVGVADLATTYGTPAYVVDEVDFRARARGFRDAFDGAFRDLCGGADVYYAAKAFVTVEVARWVAAEGLRLDTTSGGEMLVGLRAGTDPRHMTLHGNNKGDDEIARALDEGIGRIVVDAPGEVDRIAEAAAARGVRARVMIRVNVGVEAHTHEFLATAREDQKFGVALADGEAAGVAAAILARPELELLGLHCHIGSQIFDTPAFDLAIRRLVGLHAQVENEHGVAMPEMDLGGGFGVAYVSHHSPLGPHEIAPRLAHSIASECRLAGVDVPRISVEPGRAVAGPSTFTLYRVGTVKPVRLDGGGTRVYVSVDGGMSDNVRTAMYDAEYSCTVASRSSGETPVLARVVGKHCESGDIVVRDEFLPGDIGRGDLLAVPVTGAYCRNLSSQYNHTPRPPVVAVRDGASRVLLRRETEEDLLALDAG